MEAAEDGYNLNLSKQTALVYELRAELKRVDIQREIADKRVLPPAPPAQDYDCRQLLHDLTEGAGMVKITRVSPMDVFIKRN